MAKDSKKLKVRRYGSLTEQEDDNMSPGMRCPGSGIFGKPAKFDSKGFHRDAFTTPIYSSVVKNKSGSSSAKPRSTFYTTYPPLSDSQGGLVDSLSSKSRLDSDFELASALNNLNKGMSIGSGLRKDSAKWNNFSAEDDVCNAALQSVSPPVIRKHGQTEKYAPLSTSLPKSTALWSSVSDRPSGSALKTTNYDQYVLNSGADEITTVPSLANTSNTVLDVGDRVSVSVAGKKYTAVIKNVVEDRVELELDELSEMEKVKDSHPMTKSVAVFAKECRSIYQDFGGIKCPPVSGVFPPMEVKVKDMQRIIGRNKGVQGHYNSCYLDATLFSMFAFNSTFDSLLYRKKKEEDIEDYNKIRSVLNDKIVNPLRKEMYVRADRLMELRELLDKYGSVSGLTCEEKDPEEFLNSLLQQTFRQEPLLKLSSSQDSYYYQLFVEKNEKIELPTVQHLLELSLHNSNVKLKELPSCLIILMPRFGKSFKVYPRIFPPLHLEMSEIIENNPRLCGVCGTVEAEFECLDCFHDIIDTQHRLYSFCNYCSDKVHLHLERKRHKPIKLNWPSEYISQSPPSIPTATMDLFAVICIETSHYVSFVKCCNEPDAPWCFFDSMADRKGEQGGYNIPEITHSPDLDYWLSDDGYKELDRFFTGASSNEPPKHVKRLLNDVYLCMYKSVTEMYR